MDRLEATLVSTRPSLTILTAQTLPTAADLLDMALFLRERGRRVAYGGLIFSRVPSLRAHIPGTFLGDRIERTPQVVEETLVSPPGPGDYVPTPNESLAAARLFASHRPAIEAAVLRKLGSDGIRPHHLRQAQLSLGDSLEACLRLGSLDPLTADIEWLAGLLSHFNVDRRQLGDYLSLYAEAAQEHLPSGAEIAWRWLGELAGKEAAA